MLLAIVLVLVLVVSIASTLFKSSEGKDIAVDDETKDYEDKENVLVINPEDKMLLKIKSLLAELYCYCNCNCNCYYYYYYYC
jgi:hypothetical protein